MLRRDQRLQQQEHPELALVVTVGHRMVGSNFDYRNRFAGCCFGFARIDCDLHQQLIFGPVEISKLRE